ncbi:MAG: hypothetical protein HKN23_10415 [Verrucomicrobiales bacterium]|nr:hypothetical protein [Verrucomicrobiales bacterium]
MKPELIDAFLSDELSGKSDEFVRTGLHNDPEGREELFEQMRMHEALKILLSDQGESQDFADGVVARLRSEAADLAEGDDRGFAKSVLTEILEEREIATRLRWPDMVKAGAVAAAVTFLAVLGLKSVIVDPAPPAAEHNRFVARVTGAESAVWDEHSEKRIRRDGWIETRQVALNSGVAEITFNSGARVFLEGPARLSMEHANRGFLESGRLTANVPAGASGFVINTPQLNVVDIGTRFGVSVDSRSGETEVHVMQGVVEASRASGNSVPVRLTEGLAVRADSRTRSELRPISYAGDQFAVSVADSIQSDRGYLHYSFDESGGPELADEGQGLEGGRYDLTLISENEHLSTPRRSPGRNGGGLVFQAGEVLVTRLPQDFRMNEPFTLSFWTKVPPRAHGTLEDTAIATLGRHEQAESWKVCWNLDTQAGMRGALRVGFGDGFVVGTTDISDGQWHHVTVRFLGGGNANVGTHLHLFVDGKLDSISAVGPVEIPSRRVGQLQFGTQGRHGFEGWLDDVYLHMEALSVPLYEGESEDASIAESAQSSLMVN